MRKALGITAALAVAALGTLLLVTYVQNAEERALAGEEIVDVLVVDRPITRGTPAAVLESSVRAERVPLKVFAEGGVSDLAALGDLVASADLVPGEQLVASRFAPAEAVLAREAVEIPTGFVAVTLSLSPERAIGGRLIPGDHVAVVASFNPFDLNTFEPTGLAPGEIIDPAELFIGSTGEEGAPRGQTPTSTQFILRNVLVANVQIEQLPRATLEDLPDGAPALAPSGNLLVTLAAPPEDIERLIFTAEHGFIWLGSESPPISEPNTDIVTRRNIYR
jgi:pilus assembly protein CpaB